MSNHILKPCPFCKHLPEPDNYIDSIHPTGMGWRDDDNMRHYMQVSDPRGVHGQVWEVGCLDNEGGCGATMYGDSKDAVIAKWNSRPARARRTIAGWFAMRRFNWIDVCTVSLSYACLHQKAYWYLGITIFAGIFISWGAEKFWKR